MADDFESLLTGGHPNSLGRTEDVVAIVLADPARFEELFSCYRSEDDVVRLRVSSAMKRIEPERRDLIMGAMYRFIAEIGELDQPSAQWTITQLFDRVEAELSPKQREEALAIMRRNLVENTDWIVLNVTMDTLMRWSAQEPALRNWLRPHLECLSKDRRKSVSGRATKHLASYS